jgi:hypothetical protein
MNRKTVKATIPESHIDRFNKAKEAAENALMLKMSDTQYISRLVQWAIEQQAK